MKFTKLKISGLVICEPSVNFDDRGSFYESFRLDHLVEFLGYQISFCQENEVKSSYGVVRGLHYQQAPYGQAKLVRVSKGKVLDVAVDIRKGSKTFGKHVSIVLSAENKKQFLIPAGFAHGYLALEDDTIFNYKVDNYYNPKYERGIAFDDSDININWGLDREELKLSKNDVGQPLFVNSEYYNTAHKKYD